MLKNLIDYPPSKSLVKTLQLPPLELTKLHNFIDYPPRNLSWKRAPTPPLEELTKLEISLENTPTTPPPLDYPPPSKSLMKTLQLPPPPLRTYETSSTPPRNSPQTCVPPPRAWSLELTLIPDRSPLLWWVPLYLYTNLPKRVQGNRHPLGGLVILLHVTRLASRWVLYVRSEDTVSRYGTSALSYSYLSQPHMCHGHLIECVPYHNSNYITLVSQWRRLFIAIIVCYAWWPRIFAETFAHLIEHENNRIKQQNTIVPVHVVSDSPLHAPVFPLTVYRHVHFCIFARYFAICQVLHFRMTGRMARTVIALIWIWSAAIIFPWLLAYQQIEQVTPLQTIYMCSQIWPSEDWKKGFFIGVIFLFCYTIPLLLICVCYTFVACRVWFRKTPGVCSAARVIHQSKVKVLKMLIVVVILFASFWLPLYAVNVRVYFTDMDHMTPAEAELVFQTIIPVAQWLGSSNSCGQPDHLLPVQPEVPCGVPRCRSDRVPMLDARSQAGRVRDVRVDASGHEQRVRIDCCLRQYGGGPGQQYLAQQTVQQRRRNGHRNGVIRAQHAYNRCTTVVQQLYNHFTAIVQQLYNNCSVYDIFLNIVFRKLCILNGSAQRTEDICTSIQCTRRHQHICTVHTRTSDRCTHGYQHICTVHTRTSARCTHGYQHICTVHTRTSARCTHGHMHICTVHERTSAHCTQGHLHICTVHTRTSAHCTEGHLHICTLHTRTSAYLHSAHDNICTLHTRTSAYLHSAREDICTLHARTSAYLHSAHDDICTLHTKTFAYLNSAHEDICTLHTRTSAYLHSARRWHLHIAHKDICIFEQCTRGHLHIHTVHATRGHLRPSWVFVTTSSPLYIF